jgi:hypothetical protein
MQEIEAVNTIIDDYHDAIMRVIKREDQRNVDGDIKYLLHWLVADYAHYLIETVEESANHVTAMIEDSMPI